MRHFFLTASVTCVLFLGMMVMVGCARNSTWTSPGGTRSDTAKKAKVAESNKLNDSAKSQSKAAPDTSRSTRRGFLGSLFTIVTPQGISQVKSGVSTPISTPTETAATEPPARPATQVPAGPANTPASQISSREPPKPKSAARPGSPAIIKERVVSLVPAPEAEAEDDVLNVAQNTIERKLSELDPPVLYRPSLNELKSEFIRKDSRSVVKLSQEEIDRYLANGIDAQKGVYVEYDVEVTASQIRELRTRDRVTSGFRIFGIFTLIALASFLFLRIDDWTKGYLTHWLAFGAVALVGGAAAAMLCFV